MRYLSIMLLAILVVVSVLWDDRPAMNSQASADSFAAVVAPEVNHAAIQSPGPEIGSLGSLGSVETLPEAPGEKADHQTRVREPRKPIRRTVAGLWRLLFTRKAAC